VFDLKGSGRTQIANGYLSISIIPRLTHRVKFLLRVGNTSHMASQMSSFWDRIYRTDNSFFGEEPSNFALCCYNEYMKKKNDVKKILELGRGQGKDTLLCIKGH
jgi:hypothetical protein